MRMFACVLLVIVSFNLMNAPANEPIVIPDEQIVVPTPPVVPDECDKDGCDKCDKEGCDGCDDGVCPIVVEIPDTPTYSAFVGSFGCKSCQGPLHKVGKVFGKVAKVPGKIVRGAGRVARVPFRAVRGVVRARPIRRVLGRVFGRRR